MVSAWILLVVISAVLICCAWLFTRPLMIEASPRMHGSAPFELLESDLRYLEVA